MKKLIVLLAAMALVCFTVPAMAVDWNFYGSARMATYYVSDDFEDNPPAGFPAGESEDAELQWDWQGNSRIGATVKHEAVSGRFELGLKGDGSGDIDVGTRRLFGVWNFGAGSLKVGKDYTPVSQFISGQAFGGDLGLLGYGTMYGNRVGQIALSFGGFEVALMQPQTGQLSSPAQNLLRVAAIDAATDAVNSAIAAGSITGFLLAQGLLTLAEAIPDAATTGDIDQILPKIEAKFGMSFDAFNFAIRGGLNYYCIEDQASATRPGRTEDIGVMSWIIGGDGGFNFGPGYVKGALSYGRNVGNAGWNIPGNLRAEITGAGTWDGDDDVDDNNSWMAALVGGLKVSDMWSFEAGFGYRQDDPKDAPNGFDEKTKMWNGYVQSVITLAPGVYLIPEVGYYDFGNSFTDTELGSKFYLGGKWQIDF
jgi:hypothetical protein